MRIAGTLALDGSSLKLDQGGNHTLIQSNAPSGDITVTLPATTATLVGRATTDTLTNKTISGVSNTLSNIAYASLALSAGDIPYAKLTLTGSVVNADISASAAIAYSKLTLTNSVVNADVAAAAAIAYSKLNLTGSLVNADVAAAAAIALSKLAATTASRALVSDGSGFVSASSVTATELGYLSGVSGTLTENAKAQTLTNKTISGADNTLTVRLANDVTGTLPIANGGTGQTAKTAAFDALSPTTTKGDLVSRDGSNNIRLAVGANGTVLTADSAETTGLKWTAPLTNPMNAVGDVIIGGALGAATRLGIGSTGQALTVVAGAPAWATGTLGTTTNDSAAAGYVGEYIAATRLRSNATSLTSNTPKNITTTNLVLTAGDWDIGGSVTFNPAGTTSVTGMIIAVSLTSATLPAADTNSVPSSGGELRMQFYTPSQVPVNESALTFPTYRVSLAAGATFYLVAQSTFATSTMTTYGAIWARRVR